MKIEVERVGAKQFKIVKIEGVKGIDGLPFRYVQGTHFCWHGADGIFCSHRANIYVGNVYSENEWEDCVSYLSSCARWLESMNEDRKIRRRGTGWTGIKSYIF